VRSSLVAQVAVLLGLTFLPTIGQALYFRHRISWRDPVSDSLNVTQGRNLGTAALWIDARPEEEFRAGHIPDALPLNTEQWDSQLPGVLDHWRPERKLVVYCSKKTCGASREVARRLRDEVGLKNVYVLDGGWEAWQAPRSAVNH